MQTKSVELHLETDDEFILSSGTISGVSVAIHCATKSVELHLANG